jgi:hypothetical protein
LECIKAAGLQGELQVLDNKASKAYLENITDKWKCKDQLVPPDMHRHNALERAIRTGKVKAHFLSVLAGVDPSLPKLRWDLLLPQMELTLNLLRQSQYNPKISMWECLNRPFNFDATPMGPPGCCVVAHAIYHHYVILHLAPASLPKQC